MICVARAALDSRRNREACISTGFFGRHLVDRVAGLCEQQRGGACARGQRGVSFSAREPEGNESDSDADERAWGLGLGRAGRGAKAALWARWVDRTRRARTYSRAISDIGWSAHCARWGTFGLAERANALPAFGAFGRGVLGLTGNGEPFFLSFDTLERRQITYVRIDTVGVLETLS